MLASNCCNMDKIIRINIQVGEAKYPLWIDPKQEPLYREAARMVNRRLTAYSTKYRGAKLTPEDFLAMSAVELAVLCQQRGQMLDAQNDATPMNQLIDSLRDFLDTPPATSSEE